MTFDKDYPNRKDMRRLYKKSKAFDRSCRNHGTCNYCRNNRVHKYLIKIDEANNKTKEFNEEKE